MNIHDGWEKIKDWREPLMRDAVLPLLVVLVGFGSFGLGRMSALEVRQAPISITQPAATASIGEATLAAGGQVVASKSGTKYHFPWCAGALQISEKNKIYFSDAEAARAAHYTPAGNCKGLE